MNALERNEHYPSHWAYLHTIVSACDQRAPMVDVGREACKIRRVEACPISYSKKGFALWSIPFSGVEFENVDHVLGGLPRFKKCMIGRLLQRCRR